MLNDPRKVRDYLCKLTGTDWYFSKHIETFDFTFERESEYHREDWLNFKLLFRIRKIPQGGWETSLAVASELAGSVRIPLCIVLSGTLEDAVKLGLERVHTMCSLMVDWQQIRRRAMERYLSQERYTEIASKIVQAYPGDWQLQQQTSNNRFSYEMMLHQGPAPLMLVVEYWPLEEKWQVQGFFGHHAPYNRSIKDDEDMLRHAINQAVESLRQTIEQYTQALPVRLRKE